MTHSTGINNLIWILVPVEERKLLGIEDNMIRLSVGIEEVEDILDDLERGFEVVNWRHF